MFTSAARYNRVSKPILNLNNKPKRLAILTSKATKSPFGGNMQNFLDIIRAGEEMGVLVFIIVPGPIDTQSGTVEGFIRAKGQHKGYWVRTRVLTPHVVYNRVPTRRSESAPQMQKFIESLRAESIPVFNSGFFDKWTLIKIVRESELANHLPESYLCNSFYKIEYMLSKYKNLYLKPVHGLAGSGMIRIDKTYTGWSLCHQLPESKKWYNDLSRDRLLELIDSIIGKTPYILQQGITLSRFNERAYDVRVLTQKNAAGQWDLTGMGVRVSGPGAISTHVPMGGSIADLRQVLKYSFASDNERIYARLRNLSLRYANLVGRNHKDYIGEMSLDLGIDQKGKIWFFEANSKPMKFDEPDIRSKSLRRIVEYSLFLAQDR